MPIALFKKLLARSVYRKVQGQHQQWTTALPGTRFYPVARLLKTCGTQQAYRAQAELPPARLPSLRVSLLTARGIELFIALWCYLFGMAPT